MKPGKKIDVGIWVFMAVVVTMVILIALGERDRRAADTSENRPYPYASDDPIGAQASVQAPILTDYVVWNAHIDAWRFQDVENRPGRYCQYSRQPGETAILDRHTGV